MQDTLQNATQAFQGFIDSIGGWQIVIGGLLILALMILLVFFYPRLAGTIRTIREGWGWVWFVLTWTFPPVLLFIAWCFDSMHGPMLPSALASPGGVIVVILGLIWILAVQITTANDPNTPLRVLKADFYVSASWAGILIAFAAYQGGRGHPQWWTVLPALVSWIDLCAGTRAALNNAWSKNPTQLQPGER